MIIYFIVAIIVLFLDQLTKWIVIKEVNVGDSIPVIEGILYITSHRNAGAAFGILQNQRWFFIVITIIVVVGIIYYLLQLKGVKKLMSWALALILGGALGNFVDRLLYGEVVDFVDVKIVVGTFYYDFPIFNVADSALVIGVGILLIDTIIETINEMKKKKIET
jgi:signal peptidase II